MKTIDPDTEPPVGSTTEPSSEPTASDDAFFAASAGASGTAAGRTTARGGGVEKSHTVCAIKYVTPNFQQVTSIVPSTTSRSASFFPHAKTPATKNGMTR